MKSSITIIEKDIVTLDGKRIEVKYHESAVAGIIIDSAKDLETGTPYDIDTNQKPEVVKQISERS